MCDQQSLRSACAYAQSDQSRCQPLEYSMTTEQQLEFLSVKGGCTGSSESKLNTTLLEITCRGSYIYILNGMRPGYEVIIFKKH